MPKKLIKRYLPDHQTIKSNKHLQIFGDVLHDANLWSLNRRSVSKAFAIGLFMAFVPVPFQMVFAAGLAILFKGNLPLSIALVWISNPITIPPIFYFCYFIGTILMGVPEQEFAFELSWDWFVSSLSTVGGPFLLGCAACSVFFSTLGYFTINFLWRYQVTRSWKKRLHRN
ncbi:DUF2062 domain-containing protein [Thalassotalea sp. HSM 43]|uniref:DUF2062 domain-containing protein n=1 Tax=Thalassotalea sp. HSM 43 TaxID=2552945 RepID=UPI001081F822|nr:DUF2062 domain-containing protein [Thalassotalea sp. HSM 43]QBY03163.1 DUF2062 domain-containing protein [Thalassotalea sp. HSM 43]